MNSDEKSQPEHGENLYRYEDILRAIGRYIDANDVQDVVLLQSQDGILLRGYVTSTDRMQRGTRLIQHLFTSEDLKKIDELARSWRGKGSRLYN